MTKEIITNRQGFTLLVIFTLSGAYSYLFGTSCGKGVWLAYLLAALFSFLVWLILSARFEKGGYHSFFDMLDCAFGKWVGRAICALLALYALLSCTTSISLFTRFTQLTSLSKTPPIVLPLLILLLAAWALSSGLEVIARAANLLFYFVISTFAYFIIFGFPLIDVKNLLPLSELQALPILRASGTVFTNQFGDTLLLFAIYPCIKRKPARRKVMLASVAISGIATSVIALFTVLTIGGEPVSREFFPVFTSLSIRNVGGYVRHMEILTSVAMTFFVFVRQTLSIYFIASAISHMLKLRSHSRLLTPLALIITSGSQLLYWNMMSLRERIEGNLNLILLLPLQLLLPIVMCVILKIKKGHFK